MELEPGFWQLHSEFLDWVGGMQATGTFDDKTSDSECRGETTSGTAGNQRKLEDLAPKEVDEKGPAGDML